MVNNLLCINLVHPKQWCRRSYSSFQFCHLLLISIGLLPLLGIHFFLCKQTMIFPCMPCTRKEKKMGRLSVRTLRLCPAGQTVSKLLAQATRKSYHQLDLEMHMEVRRFASNICPGFNTGSLPPRNASEAGHSLAPPPRFTQPHHSSSGDPRRPWVPGV